MPETVLLRAAGCAQMKAGTRLQMMAYAGVVNLWR
ncbi:hypothetical protein [Brenneria roseae]